MSETEKKDTKDAIQLARFEIPSRLERIEDPANPNHVTFVAEPIETGFGHTLGNSLRRVLLSSLEGAAITSVRIAGAQHEFTSLPGVVEDVTEIVLNLKKVKFVHHGKEPRTLSLRVTKQGVVTAGDIQEDTMYEVVNKDQVICTLDQNTILDCDFEVNVGRGFHTSEENKVKDRPIGVIPIDSIFSPVVRVKYGVENARVGQMTEYDKLIMEVWTDGRISPNDAMLQASAILRHHLDVFVESDERQVTFEQASSDSQDGNTAQLRKLLNMSVNEIELSVRAANCLNNANITTVGQLAMKTESEMLKYRNFGKKSLNEIKDKLVQHGLSLGMQFDPKLLSGPAPAPKMRAESDDVRAADIHALISHNIEAYDDDEV
ncbi:DNA-directed RNA polymerase subunit alpha [Akkermansia glycaniphila]|uniref:DNA-directed RNA polymerase subunit alpha n=1 Tax=Akkermansia glycaniphila TaxID=1679444 RepID=A0A1C7PDU5_9BACT|nr:DNA-directed RNA polymerase subunit alpha [Akkermansia glycaniphila]MBT9448852.1 DNA-directed RNA polymerase subunit alpha [Akkermansia glycaniphila]OCA03579.1 DNA-directed RNA polymerase subunit alpha [Akkermansia glycaniphila]SEH74854.1 rna polymerase alpha dna-directed subunit chain nucleotidyltransferase transferase transcription transcriptase [Akkermansia glycaniphila]